MPDSHAHTPIPPAVGLRRKIPNLLTVARVALATVFFVLLGVYEFEAPRDGLLSQEMPSRFTHSLISIVMNSGAVAADGSPFWPSRAIGTTT